MMSPGCDVSALLSQHWLLQIFPHEWRMDAWTSMGHFQFSAEQATGLSSIHCPPIHPSIAGPEHWVCRWNKTSQAHSWWEGGVISPQPKVGGRGKVLLQTGNIRDKLQKKDEKDGSNPDTDSPTAILQTLLLSKMDLLLFQEDQWKIFLFSSSDGFMCFFF